MDQNDPDALGPSDLPGEHRKPAEIASTPNAPWTSTVLIDPATILKVRDDILIGTLPNRFRRVKGTAAP